MDVASSDISRLRSYLGNNRRRIAASVAFFLGAFAVGVVDPRAVPVAAAALLVRPLRFGLFVATDSLSESAYRSRSPLAAGATDPVFVAVLAALLAFALGTTATGLAITWDALGTLPFVVGVASIGVLSWSEALYAKNAYLDRWHPIERLAVVGLGIASAFSTVFVPLFLLVHRVVTEQFRYPSVAGFNYTHSALPHSALFVLSGAAIVDVVVPVGSATASFLLMCAFAAHYVYAGIEKLRFGPRYYLFENNPLFMLLNAHRNGMYRSLSADAMARIGLRSNRVRPLFNLGVLAIELGALLLLLSPRYAAAIGLLAFLLHLGILGTSGINFWKWMAVDLALVVGLWIQLDAQAAVFVEPGWLVLSVPFILFAKAWMQPSTLGWLDSPYYEYATVEGRSADTGEFVTFHPNFLRPFDDAVSRGVTGPFTFLGQNPRITYSLGDIRDASIHSYVTDIYPDVPSQTEEERLRAELGTRRYDADRTAELRSLFETYLSEERFAAEPRTRHTFASPREFYSEGYPSTPPPLNRLTDVRLVRIDGIWTRDGFHEVDREVVFTLSV